MQPNFVFPLLYFFYIWFSPKRPGKDAKQQGSKKMRNKENMKQELNERQKQNIKEAFDLFDVDGSGIIKLKKSQLRQSNFLFAQEL